MTEKEIITKFVNSDSFPIIHNYVSKSYEDTINELQQEKDNLIKYLENTIKQNEKDDKKKQGYNFYQDVLERVRSNNYD